jgi:transposase-like protein
MNAPFLVVSLCVRWYCRFQLSYRDIEEMMRQRGLDIARSTTFRWVQRYAPDIMFATLPRALLLCNNVRDLRINDINISTDNLQAEIS